MFSESSVPKPSSITNRLQVGSKLMFDNADRMVRAVNVFSIPDPNSTLRFEVPSSINILRFWSSVSISNETSKFVTSYELIIEICMYI